MNWEYKTLCLSIRGFMTPSVDTKEIDKELGRLGRLGWELVSAFDTNAGGGSFQFLAVFKRPAAAKAQPA